MKLPTLNLSCLARSGLRPAVLVICLLGATVARASVPSEAADRQWAELQALLAPPPAEPPQSAPGPEERVRARRQQAQRFLRAAALAKDFVANNPAHAQAAEAHRLEAKSLLLAAMVGEVSGVAEARELVEAVRRDPALPAKARLELVSLAEV